MVSVIAGLWVFWLLYVAIMNLYRAHKARTLSLPAKILGYPALFIGLVLDVTFNATVFTIVFLEIPRQWLVTQRLAGHVKNGGGWRKKVAMWICVHLLNPFDPDQRGHCR